MMNEPPNRRLSVPEEVNGAGFSFAVPIGFDPTFGTPCEVFLTKRGKSGSELEATLYQLGVHASKIMQEYDVSGKKIERLRKEVQSLKQALKALSA